MKWLDQFHSTPRSSFRRRAWPSRHLSAAAALALSVSLVAACSGGQGAPRPNSATSTSTRTSTAGGGRASGGCTLSAKAVPSCGVLWGMATKPSTPAAVRVIEQQIGRPLDFVYRYHDVNDVVPDAAEKKLVASGHLLHIAIAARIFGRGAKPVTWAGVAAGTYDSTLAAQAAGVAALGKPVFVTFEQEANQQHKLATLGSPADFVRAWRHLHDIYAKAGASNAVWVWVMTGSQENLAHAAALWPGNDMVDWISWNVYNQSGCRNNQISAAQYVTFEQKMLIFYRWVTSTGRSSGIDAAKPMMISETGSAQYAGDLQKTADWYAAIPGVLQKYPQIKAVGLWDSINQGCDYKFDRVPQVMSAVRSAGLTRSLVVRQGAPAGQ